MDAAEPRVKCGRSVFAIVRVSDAENDAGCGSKRAEDIIFCVNKLQKIHSVIQSDMMASIQRQDLACHNRNFFGTG